MDLAGAARTVSVRVFSSVRLTEQATPPTVALVPESKPLPRTVIRVPGDYASFKDGSAFRVVSARWSARNW